MVTTENGWPQINASQLDKSRLVLDNGRSIPAETAGGDAGLVLRCFFRWLDRNVETIDRGIRDDWFWSATNSVWNSNHLSGTAGDENATQWPMGPLNMPAWMVSKINEGIRLFEGTIFWGRVWRTPDEMHFQIQGNAAQIAPFAQKLREGYLALVEGATPRDPLSWPLPLGYYYGPLDGPNESISGLYANDSQWAKDHLGLWQDWAKVPVTQHWDADTADAVAALQQAKGWYTDDNPYKGVLYTGEWDEVFRHGWKWDGRLVPEPAPADRKGVYYSDISQYQDNPATPGPDPVNDQYPYRILSYRINTGNQLDGMAEANHLAAVRLLAKGKLDAIIPYYFHRPRRAGHNSVDTFISFLNQWEIPRQLIAMVDVESGSGSALGRVEGDQSREVNGDIDALLRTVGGDQRRVLGYHNAKADPGLWTQLPPWLKMVRPNYSIQPGKGFPEGPQAIIHQYTDKGRVAPWGGDDVDVNFFPGTLNELLDIFGVREPAGEVPQTPTPEPEVVEITVKPGQIVRLTGA